MPVYVVAFISAESLDDLKPDRSNESSIRGSKLMDEILKWWPSVIIPYEVGVLLQFSNADSFDYGPALGRESYALNVLHISSNTTGEAQQKKS